MIKTYDKQRLIDENKKNDVFVEVNWNKQKTPCEFVRFTLGGKEAIVKKEYLLLFLFQIGNEDEQRKMIPQTQTRSRWYNTVVTVKAKKDLKAGEELTFPLKLTIPDVTEEVIGEIKK